MSVQDAMLVVQVLGAIECRTVAQMAACDQAKALLKSLRDQVGRQAK